MQHNAVIFDLDGTLLDTLDDLADSMNVVLAEHGFPTHPTASYRYFVGDGMANLVRRAFPETVSRSEEAVAQGLAAMRAEYDRRWNSKTRPYPGVSDMLDALVERHVKIAVLSNKPHEFTLKTVEALLSNWTFDVVLGERPPIPRKPDPQGAVEVSRLLGIPPQRILYLGDTGTDMLTATRAGMTAVGALWGFREAEELRSTGASTLIERPMDLLDLL